MPGSMMHGNNNNTGDRAAHFWKTLVQLVAYCRRYWAQIGVAILFSVIGTILTVIAPEKVKDITNLISQGLRTGIDIGDVARLAGIVTLLYAFSFIFNLFKGLILAGVAARVSRSLRGDICAKINNLPLGYFNSSSIGDTMSRVTNDVDTVSQVLGQSFGSFVAQIVMFFGSMIMMFYTNWIMALAAIIATAIGLALMMLILSRSQKYFIRQQRELGAINGYIEERYTGLSVVKAYNAESDSRHEFDRLNQDLYSSAWKSQFISGLTHPLMNLVGNLGYVTVCVVGALLAWNGYISFGVIVAFILYVDLFGDAASQFSSMLSNLQSAAAASERVFEFLSLAQVAPDRGRTIALSDVRGDVEFCHVSFGYEPNDIIIKDFSANISAGQKVAIVGPTGAGKTTLVNLLMRFYDLNGGEILIDGVPTTTLRRSNVRSMFCMVLQDTWLFHGTIRENIVYDKRGVTDDVVIAAARAVGLDKFIQTLPSGYNTVLDDATTLSAGQRQLLTIARAMVKNAPMLILDEATSSVDTRTEIQIQRAMDKLMHGRTSFIIAHRLSTIRDADLILVMRDGNIIESGTHDELMARGGFYTELYNSQFDKIS